METRQGDVYDCSSGAVYLLRELAGISPLQAAIRLEKIWLLLDVGATSETDLKKEKLQMSILKEVRVMVFTPCAPNSCPMRKLQP